MTNLQYLKWHVSENGSGLARETAAKIVHEARLAIGRHDRFNIVLAGGQTPFHTYRHLARSDTDWSRWHVFFGDERCVPREDPLRNDQQILDHFLNETSVPATQVYHMMADAGFEIAISDYEKKIRRALPFDVVMLGVGEDGHTASLFPGLTYEDNHQVVSVRGAPKPPPDRISLAYDTLCNARKVIIMIEGENKRAAVKSWLAGEDLPVSRIRGLDSTDVYIDKSAYPA